jgi:site-specific recombinase XerD
MSSVERGGSGPHHEVLSLTVSDVWQAGPVVDRVTVRRRHMKGQRAGRTVPLHPDAQAAIAVWLVDLKALVELTPATYLFRSRKGQNRPISRVQVWQILKDAYSSNGLTGKLGTHSLRKTFARRIYAKVDRDLLDTQQALGHVSITSTVHYLDVRQERVDAAILGL